MKYENAVTELEQIVAQLESGDMDLDAITTKLKRARALVKFCNESLTKADNEIQKILDGRSDFITICLHICRI